MIQITFHKFFDPIDPNIFILSYKVLPVSKIIIITLFFDFEHELDSELKNNVYPPLKALHLV